MSNADAAAALAALAVAAMDALAKYKNSTEAREIAVIAEIKANDANAKAIVDFNVAEEASITASRQISKLVTSLEKAVAFKEACELKSTDADQQCADALKVEMDAKKLVDMAKDALAKANKSLEVATEVVASTAAVSDSMRSEFNAAYDGLSMVTDTLNRQRTHCDKLLEASVSANAALTAASIERSSAVAAATAATELNTRLHAASNLAIEKYNQVKSTDVIEPVTDEPVESTDESTDEPVVEAKVEAKVETTPNTFIKTRYACTDASGKTWQRFDFRDSGCYDIRKLLETEILVGDPDDRMLLCLRINVDKSSMHAVTTRSKLMRKASGACMLFPDHASQLVFRKD